MTESSESVDVDDESQFGNGKEVPNNDAVNRNAFYTLKERRKGLIFQSIRKNKGIFDVSVQVDFIKYFGKGETQTKANNMCAAKVLAAIENGQHEKDANEKYENSFKELQKSYSNLLYQTLARSSSDNTFEVYVNVEGIDYYGVGQTIHRANNDAAWEALKNIWSGEHQRQLENLDEYWYDDEDYSSTMSDLSTCCCSCHHCSCCC